MIIYHNDNYMNYEIEYQIQYHRTINLIIFITYSYNFSHVDTLSIITIIASNSSLKYRLVFLFESMVTNFTNRCCC